jgi:hypothetical protein
MVMRRIPSLCTLMLCALMFCVAISVISAFVAAEETKDADPKEAGHKDPACLNVDRFFADEVWGKVGSTTCLKCHQLGGDAADSKFLLTPPVEGDRQSQLPAQRLNWAAFQRMATQGEGELSLLLVKARGGADHGGGQVLEQDGTGYKILAKFAEQAKLSGTDPSKMNLDEQDLAPFFDGVSMLTPTRLLRRLTLSLAGRLPTAAERARITEIGAAPVEPIIAAIVADVLQEQAFYDRLKEGFNDIMLLRGYDGNAEVVLSYDHFNKTRNWTQAHDLTHVPEKERQKARYALARVYREALLREPYELIEFIVRNDRPFTELVTADYIMVSPYTARGYGIYDQLKDQFKDPEDPYEYISTRLPALKHRDGKVQESSTGFYPHSGLLTTFHYTRRYPTTETNRNRLRARMYYQHFLGVDIMQLAPRVTDAAAVDAAYEIPTMQAADCVVCHKTVDPLAGLFQNYDKDGYFSPPRKGWHEDMFGPGREGDTLPAEEGWRSLQWLGQRTASDPRFPIAMAEHIYYILAGRAVLQPPKDIDDPRFTSRRRAFLAQRAMIKEVATRFAQSDFNLRVAIQAMVASEFYRVDGTSGAVVPHSASVPQNQANWPLSDERAAELDDIGVVRLLTPEQLERKIDAIFGERWGRLDPGDSKLDILYGGIDSKEITERITNPSGAMGAIQRIMANEIACKHVARDFAMPIAERRLFPGIELDVVPNGSVPNGSVPNGSVPGNAENAELKIKAAIVHLHERILGLEHTADHEEVERTYQLFAGIIQDAKSQEGVSPLESYFCGLPNEKRVEDPHYTHRAWRAVVTYLLRQRAFLYE